MGAELVEPELGRHREGGLGEASPFLLLAGDLSDAGREGQNPGRLRGDRVAGERFGTGEMLAGEVVLTTIPRNTCEKGFGFGGAGRVADSEECVAGGFERLLLPRVVVGPVECNGQLEQEGGALGVIGPECERILVLRRCDGKAVEHKRAIPGRTECASRSLDYLVVVATGSPDQLQRGAPVVREHLGVILRAAEPSIHSATARCFCARSARGIWP